MTMRNYLQQYVVELVKKLILAAFTITALLSDFFQGSLLVFWFSFFH